MGARVPRPSPRARTPRRTQPGGWRDELSFTQLPALRLVTHIAGVDHRAGAALTLGQLFAREAVAATERAPRHHLFAAIHLLAPEHHRPVPLALEPGGFIRGPHRRAWHA